MKKRALGVWCVLAVETGGRRTLVFFLSGGRFFNGAEAELRRDGVAVFVGGRALFACFSCGALLLFILVLEIFVWN